MDPNPVKDFFISYNKADRAWAEWIGWQLEQEGYSCIVQAWDFRPGGNFVLGMQRAATQAQRTIAVFSPDYLTALYTQSEWAAAFVQDPTGKDGKLLPVRVRECEPDGMLAAIIYIDLFKLDEPAARAELLTGVKRTRAKPTGPLPFPGTGSPTPKPPISFPGNWPEVWEVPYRRNTFFTGRDELLEQLHEQFLTQITAPRVYIQAISGLGGIGKTQIALEYAHRRCNEYHFILWVTATTAESLMADYLKLAETLQIPGRNEQDQQTTANLFKSWLGGQQNWLLVLDDANELEAILKFLPSNPHTQGHIILTTLSSALGPTVNKIIDVGEMSVEEGKLFLLRRTKKLSSDISMGQISLEEQESAEAIVKALEGLPLALDQTATYIEEVGCNLSDYLNLYQTRSRELMEWRGGLTIDHPKTAFTTWLLLLQKIEQENPSAIAVLQLCAFFSPDSIQEEMIIEGAAFLGRDLKRVVSDKFKLNEAIKILRKYSLVIRNTEEKSIKMHGLVQMAIKNNMDKRKQIQYFKKVIKVVNNVFPLGEYKNWGKCQHYLSQAQVCIKLIQQYQIEISEAANLLYNVGYYFHQQQVFRQAEECYLQALQIREKLLGFDHPDRVSILYALAHIYRIQSKYNRAEELVLQILSLQEKVFGMGHINTAPSLHELACIYYAQGKYKYAAYFHQDVLQLRKKVLGYNHLDTATTLHALGNLSFDQGNYERAEDFILQAFSIQEKLVGHDHPETASTLFSFAVLYRKWRQPKKAELFYRRALDVREKVLGLGHPDTINTIESYAQLLRQTGRFAEARNLLAHINLKSFEFSS